MTIPTLNTQAVKHCVMTVDLKDPISLEKMDATSTMMPNHFFEVEDLPDIIQANHEVAYRNMTFFCDIYTGQSEVDKSYRLPTQCLVDMAINVLTISNEDFLAALKDQDREKMFTYIIVLFHFASEQERNYEFHMLAGKPLAIH